MARKKNLDWNLPDTLTTWEQVAVAVLMDIRDELQAIRRLAECHRIPRALDTLGRIDRRLQASGMLVGPKRRSRR
jgi:hypothetical protein